jgi:hypothetical protein
MTTKYFYGILCLIVLAACIAGSGCTTNQNTQGSAQSSPTLVATPSQTIIPTTPQVTIVTSMTTTTVPAVIVSATQTPTNNGLSVTLNSAEKKTTLGGNPAKTGNAFLVLDVSIQNNDSNKDFAYTDTSFRIIDIANNGSWHPAMTSQISRGLNNPLMPGNIPSKTKKSGQIGFGVLNSSNSYKFSVVDSTGVIVATIDTINVP